MSFASILSGPTDDQPARKPSPQPPVSLATPTQTHSGHNPRDQEPGPVPGTFYHKITKGPDRDTQLGLSKVPQASNGPARQGSQHDGGLLRAPQRKPFPPGVDAEQVSRALAEIDAAEKSDVENSSFGPDLALYQDKCHKRSLSSDRMEGIRRKVIIQKQNIYE